MSDTVNKDYPKVPLEVAEMLDELGLAFDESGQLVKTRNTVANVGRTPVATLCDYIIRLENKPIKLVKGEVSL